MSAMETLAYEWKDLPWKEFEVAVYKLQKRIYKASQRGDVKTVHRLQKLLMKSWAAKCLAVRRVTQDNRGKKTPGVDGVKALSPRERLELAQSLTIQANALPVSRVWIPKPGRSDKRPLGIPTMGDRAAQTLVRLALEPEWEAYFEPNSFGFRPGRSCQDAVRAVYDDICRKPKFVLDADIAACFDRINHEALLNKLSTFPTLRRVIRAWLKAGVMEGGKLFPTEAGTPQGGTLSPLLANIALHGLEKTIRAAFPTEHRGKRLCKPLVVRYADDFVVMHEDLAVIEQVQQIASEWLSGMGLELKPSKTRITHTLDTHNGNLGFDFLGFTVRQFRVGKSHQSKGKLGYKTIIKPSAEAQKQHLHELAEVVDRHQQQTQESLIAHLNPKIRGWTNYFSRQVSKRVFGRMDHMLYQKLKRWAERRHPKKAHKWVVHHYWHSRGERNWVFGSRNGTALALHADTPVHPHVRVRGEASPFDGNLMYWASRMGRHPELPARVALLLKRQKGKCALCGLYFKDEDLLEVDHIIPLSRSGKDAFNNWQLLHRHCHDKKTATDGSYHPKPMEVLVNEPNQPVGCTDTGQYHRGAG